MGERDESESAHAGMTVEAGALVAEGADAGEDCRIGHGAFVAADVRLGARVEVGGGARLLGPLEVADDVSIGPLALVGATSPGRDPDGTTVLEEGATIAGGAIVLAGARVGRGAQVSPGAVVGGAVPPFAVVEGDPVRIVGYLGSTPSAPSTIVTAEELFGTTLVPLSDPAVHPLEVAGVAVHRLRLVRDLRGDLTVGEFDGQIPFPVRRYFLVANVPDRKLRGEHAHRVCHQFLICAHGSIRVMVDDGVRRVEVLLDRMDMGLHVPPMVWASQFDYTDDAVLLVFASETYDAADYIRNYDEFRAAAPG